MAASISENGRFKGQFAFFIVIALLGLAPISNSWTATALDAQPPPAGLSDPEKNFGIRILTLRPTAAGSMLDMRFQVVNPEKARPILDKGKKAFLLDQASGKALSVPVTKAGSWRQTTSKPEAGRIYFVLFGNPNKLVKENNKVTVVIGDFKKNDIVVDSSGAAPVSIEKAAPVKKDAETGKPCI
jgi:hypothetical protein